VPEIRRLQTCTVRKGRSSLKEAVATRHYEGRGLGLYDPFRTMGRGVHFCGEAKGMKPGAVGKPIVHSADSHEA
jgi:hypothetical protein